jgi:hypothetical protein
MLSRLAREFAAEIRYHDWSDAHTRLDRAGHRREHDRAASANSAQLTSEETGRVRTNVFWVVAQVLKHADPNLDLFEFATACDVPEGYIRTRHGEQNGMITAGIRFSDVEGRFARLPALLEENPSWPDAAG